MVFETNQHTFSTNIKTNADFSDVAWYKDEQVFVIT